MKNSKIPRGQVDRSPGSYVPARFGFDGSWSSENLGEPRTLSTDVMTTKVRFSGVHCARVDQPAGELGTVAFPAPPDTFLREKLVLEITGLGRSSMWSYCNPRSRYHDPSFPKPVKIGARAVAWRASEIFGWVASRRAFK